MSFLKAQWENLMLVNYKIDPATLKPYLPAGTSIDLFNNNCYISLVGFMFKNTKVLGLKIPYHINFEEVNLRFYVKYNGKRGVVFIKEIVPKPIITFIANTLYKEHYETHKMANQLVINKDSKFIEYSWNINNTKQFINVTSDLNPKEIKPNTEEEFITEHYFGYTKYKNKTTEYEVKHPKWEQFNILNHQLKVDYNFNYGGNFEFLNYLEPSSIILAKGSSISVENKQAIDTNNSAKT